MISMTESCWFLMQCCLRTTGIKEMSPDSLSLLIPCTVDAVLFKVQRTAPQFVDTVFSRWLNLPIFTSERFCVSKVLFLYQII